MTEQEAIDMLEQCIQNSKEGDTEVAHLSADEILCSLLRELGYDKVIDAWEKVDKWYA